MTRVVIDVPVSPRHLRAAARALERVWRPETAAFLHTLADRAEAEQYRRSPQTFTFPTHQGATR